jgi:hypothetical protein
VAEIRVAIPDAWAPRVLEAICVLYGYADTLSDGSPNPETKAAFAKRIVGRWIKEQLVRYETTQAADIAARAKQGEFDALDIG